MSEILSVDPFHPDDRVLKRAAAVVAAGGLIVYPTETVYGIGADATNPFALRRVSEAKGRKAAKPILVVVNSTEMMLPYVKEIRPAARRLMERFWPGPLTLVFAASDKASPELTQDTGTIGIRIPSSQVCLQLVSQLGAPLTSTSANLSGTEPARAIQEIRSRLRDIEVFLDAGELPESLPSTIVDVSGEVFRVLRRGAIAVEELTPLVAGIEM